MAIVVVGAGVLAVSRAADQNEQTLPRIRALPKQNLICPRLQRSF